MSQIHSFFAHSITRQQKPLVGLDFVLSPPQTDSHTEFLMDFLIDFQMVFWTDLQMEFQTDFQTKFNLIYEWISEQIIKHISEQIFENISQITYLKTFQKKIFLKTNYKKIRNFFTKNLKNKINKTRQHFWLGQSPY